MTKILKVETRNGIVEFCNDDGGIAAAAFARKHGGTVLTAGNEGPGDNSTNIDCPVPSPGACSLLGLSMAAVNEPDEFRAAFVANGRKYSPRLSGPIRNALVNYWRTKRGGDVDAAVAFVKARHPLLFPQEKTANTPGGANERQPIMAANEGPDVMLCTGPVMPTFQH